MKIVIIKSFADDYDCDLLQTDEDINPLSYTNAKERYEYYSLNKVINILKSPQI